VVGCAAYADATTLLITADADDGNGARLRLWSFVWSEPFSSA
jgi:hypothetical protein